MAWARYESAFVKHPKVQTIPEGVRSDAIALHLAASGYCAELLTDGLIPEAVIPDLARVCGIKRHRKALEWLQKTRLILTPNSTEIRRYASKFDVQLDPAPKTLLVNDYLEYNPSRHAVMADRERAAERQRRARERSKQGMLDVDVTDERNSVTSHRESREKSRRSRARDARTRPVPSPESVSSLRGGSAVREPAADELALAAGSTPNGAIPAMTIARLRINAIGHELPISHLNLELQDALGDRITELTDTDHNELRALHTALQDPEPHQPRP